MTTQVLRPCSDPHLCFVLDLLEQLLGCARAVAEEARTLLSFQICHVDVVRATVRVQSCRATVQPCSIQHKTIFASEGNMHDYLIT